VAKRQKSISEWFVRYDRAIEGRGYADSTRRLYALRLRLFADWLRDAHAITTAEGVRPEHLGDYQAWLVDVCRKKQGGRLSTGAQAQRLAPIKAFFRWLSERGALPSDPAKELVLPVKPKTLPRDVPTVREIANVLRRLLAHKDKHRLRNSAIVATLFCCGCRQMELARLRLSDVDLDSREVRIEKAKNRQGRISFITPWCAKLLRRYTEKERPRYAKKTNTLFLSEQGKQLSPERLGFVVAEAFRPVQGKHVSCHSLRHAFCVSLLRGGAGVRVIAELAGHRRLASTAIYTRLELRDLRLVHERAFL
jgi:integrase/recombinase XerD